MTTPYIFDEFFTSGKEESISPFLTLGSRKWAENLHLKSSLFSGACLLASFFFSFFHPPLSAFFLTIVFFLSGTPALLNTFGDLKSFEINIDTLMTVAAFLSVLIGSGIEGGLLLVLFDFSGAMEIAVSQKAKSALNTLNRLSPTMANLLSEDGTLVQKSVREITVGQKLLVRAGEVVPLDGTVIEGHSYVNMVHLTGESVPISKTEGDEVQAGSRNLDGSLTIHVTKSSADSTLTRIIKLIHQAQEMKPQFQKFLDRFGKPYATTIIGLFFLFAITLPWISSMTYLGVEGSIYRALTFLIAASPCALIIATPTAYLSAISACAKKGILLKGGVTLDALASCKTIAFDKTGTLTTGNILCDGVEMLQEGPFDIDSAIGFAAALERHVTHPMGLAICKYAEEKSIPLPTVESFKEISGFGLEGTIAKKSLYIGNSSFILSKGGDRNLIEKAQETYGNMLTFLLIDGQLFLFHFSDKLRLNITLLLKELTEKLKLKLLMLTGDHQKSASAIANELGITDFYADLRPENKMETISDLSQRENLAMVGDGINDAPALARATVGISMGQIGSATAIDASDIILLRDELPLLSWLIRRAHKTLHIVRQNITLALAVICLATTPALLGFIPLWLAVILHEGGTVLVGLNSLRLLRKS